MKTKNLFTAATALLAFALAGCIGELPEEQFEKYVLLTVNGWSEQDIKFTTSNTAEFPIPISISGTSSNNENVDVKLQYDLDLLARYNLEKYKLQEDLYYSAVPNDAITLTEEVSIAAGSENGVATLVIDFNKISDPFKDYVLPISIKTTSSYKLQPLGQAEILKRSEALYHIRRVNSFSGDYSGSVSVYQTNGRGSIVSPYVIKGSGSPVPVKTLYALSENECYFFAGQIDRNHVQRNDFIVNVRIDENDSLIFSSPNSTLRLIANPELIKDPIANTIKTVRKDITSDQRYELVTKTFEFCYTFYDLTDKSDSTSTNNHILRAQGAMSREKRELKN